MTGIIDQFYNMCSRHGVNDRSLVRTLYKVFSRSDRNGTLYIMLDNRCDLFGTMQLIVVNNSMDGMMDGFSGLDPVKVTDNSIFLSKAFKLSNIPMTVSSAGERSDLATYMSKKRSHVLYGQSKYHYMYDNIKESNERLHNELHSKLTIEPILSQHNLCKEVVHRVMSYLW